MRLRAYIHERKEYFYPNSKSYLDMSEFYAVLEGYRMKGLTTTIDYGTGVEDHSGVEIYTNDQMKITYYDKSMMIRDRDEEEGWVEFSDAGTFMVTNEDGLMWELSNVILGDNLFKLEITGRRNEKV